MPRPPVKKTRRLSEATELGKLNAQRKFRKKEKMPERALRYFETLLGKTQIQPVDAALNAGLAYLGFEKSGKRWEGALLGPVSLALAKADNVISGAVGVAGLISLGVLSIAPEVLNQIVAGYGDIVSKEQNRQMIIWNTQAGRLTEGQCLTEMQRIGVDMVTATLNCKAAVIRASQTAATNKGSVG